MNILSVSGKITPQQDKTNIIIPFSVPEGIEKLVVNYEYNPKTVENRTLAEEAIIQGLRKYNVEVANAGSFMPINNLVTLSFDENGSYRGACHRHPNHQEIEIGEKDSTAGIINKPIEAGQWDVVINVHYVGCDVDYTINIEGVER